MDGEEQGPTGISLPSTLPYPFTVTRLFTRPGTSVSRGSPLFEYSFTSATSRKALERKTKGLPAQEGDDDARESDMVGVWDSELEGDLTKWADWLILDAVIERNYSGKDAVWVKQPCDHRTQFMGMCALCGASLTADDYLSRPAEGSRTGSGSAVKKGYTLTHDAMGVTVSTTEAKRLDNLSRDTLLSARKLSLIVDLDQTIIHTTVEPTIGEWLDEIEADKRARAAQAQPPANGSTTPPTSPKMAKERNPNEKALRDVAKFQLGDDLPPGYDRRKGKGRLPLDHDRWYYTKPRPGLTKFLKEMNDIYEMHVYTMGTRSYADAICKVIDPTGAIFGGRILSRDESGSLSEKSLKRLFPTDQSMVVVIDDRSDVWGDIPNLVKVVPYDFFGIGDINATFLPPNPDKPLPSSPSPSARSNIPATSAASSPSTAPPVTPPPIDTDIAGEEGKIAKAKMLDELSESRPLAKLQRELEETANGAAGEAVSTTDEKDSADSNGGPSGTEASTTEVQKAASVGEATLNKSTTPPGSPAKARKPLLNPYDSELVRVSNILSRIHRSFYSAYEARTDRSAVAPLPLNCDVLTIIPEIKASVLDGYHIVFSGVIPLNVPAHKSEPWAQAEMFGAVPSTDVTPYTTHCVVGREGTEKAYKADKMGAKIVWMEWFNRCVALWEREDETPWTLKSRREEVAAPSRTSSGNGSAPVDGPDLMPESKTSEVSKEEEEDGGFEGGGWDDDFLKQIQDEMGDDASEYGTEDGTVDDPPSSPPRSVLASPRDSRAGSVESLVSGSMPGTPRKRVRYADEESLPLESFKDPSPDAVVDRPRKKPRGLLLPPSEGDVPEANRFTYNAKGRMLFDPEETGEEGQEQGESPSTLHQLEEDWQEEEEDEFARMLRESMDEEGEDERDLAESTG